MSVPLAHNGPWPDELSPAARDTAVARLRAIVSAVEPATTGSAPAAPEEPVHAAAGLLAAGDAAVCWLTLAVLRAEFPDTQDVTQALRLARLRGPEAVLTRELELLAAAPTPHRRVQVLAGAVTVDVHHTAGARYVSGIQRVVRETALRWSRTRPATFVGWTSGFGAFRPLSAAENKQLFGGSREGGDADAGSDGAGRVLVPWRGTHLLPELGAEPDRSRRLQALAAVSGTQLAAIGHDCIPITSADTIPADMSGLFAGYLAALRHASRLATTSAASSAEFLGWRRMIAAAGFVGPDIAEVPFPLAEHRPSPADVALAREQLCVPGLALVLVVGSHEPRKNHLAVLQAAEILWREGLRFNLVFVGTGTWAAEGFRAKLAELTEAGRPACVVVGLSDDLLWAAYALARCVVFPSLNEGFGLPIAEALAAGAPVVTSDFGSMREIVAPTGEPRGGVMVDPRDDHAVAAGLRTVLLDDNLLARTKAESARRSGAGWDDYAAAAWDYLVSGRVSGRSVNGPSDGR